MTFEDLNLNKPLLNALNDLEYIHPTPIQQQTFSVIMSGKDLVATAQTGTGKTFAYLLPILRQLKYSEQKHPRVLIVVPTRELVLQIGEEIKKLTTYMQVRHQGVYGGTNINTQKQLVYNGIDILIATPGRLVDLVLTGILRLKDIQKVVIDEVDQLFSLGFRQQLNSFLETIPPKRQNLLFSATITNEIQELINTYFNSPHKIEIEPHGTPLEKILQIVYAVPNFNTKVNLLEHLLESDTELTKVLVFINNKTQADFLCDTLQRKFPDQIDVIHSRKAQNKRIQAIKNFKNATCRILIATDIVARGLDITDVSHVINFDTSPTPEEYIHRIGRTGRAKKDGIAITFSNPAEELYIEAIEKLMNKRLEHQAIPAAVKISTVLTDDEMPVIKDKNLNKNKTNKEVSGPAFHEKKEKNKKVNLGGPGRREKLKGKNAKIRTRRHDS
ncbi:MAG TPA: DEAD/DEAH box helicase [Bacteroidia bacterium]|nr:DEAD/DEAH box helicase [Bacteroidia bacterium]